MSHDNCNNNESLLAELTLNKDIRVALKKFSTFFADRRIEQHKGYHDNRYFPE